MHTPRSFRSSTFALSPRTLRQTCTNTINGCAVHNHTHSLTIIHIQNHIHSLSQSHIPFTSHNQKNHTRIHNHTPLHHNHDHAALESRELRRGVAFKTSYHSYIHISHAHTNNYSQSQSQSSTHSRPYLEHHATWESREGERSIGSWERGESSARI